MSGRRRRAGNVAAACAALALLTAPAAARTGAGPDPAAAPGSAPPAAEAAAGADTGGARPPATAALRAGFGRGAAAFLLGAAAAVALVAPHDRALTAHATAWRTPAARNLASVARALGDPLYVAPARAATWGADRLAHRPARAAASDRIAFSIGVAGAATLALKQAIGRARPDDSPGDAARFRPFSGDDAFPSGHATVAFALASATCAEWRAPLVPWIAYPLASLTAWSRVRDDRHWTSDVVAGAALGAWTARGADAWARRRWPRGLIVLLVPRAGGGELVLARAR